MKFVLLGVGVLGTMGFLLAVGINTPGGFAYYLTVSEFVEGDSRGQDDVRLNGRVVTGSIERRPNRSQVRFEMHEGGASLPVVYEGIIPDTFVDDAEVVVQGTLLPDGTFQADLLLAKCPSKYEGASYEEHEAALAEPKAESE